jgi:hypothetical protein
MAERYSVCYGRDEDEEIMNILRLHRCRQEKERRRWYLLDEAAANKAKAEIEALIDGRQRQFDAMVADLEMSSASPETYSDTGRSFVIDPELNVAKEIKLPDGRLGWLQRLFGPRVWRSYLPSDAANVVRLHEALKREELCS